MSGDNGKGRRRYERLMREIPFHYEIVEQEGHPEFGRRQNGLILDISPGGVRFLTMEMIAKNTILAMEFDLRDLFEDDYKDYLPGFYSFDETVKVNGKVMWSTVTAMEDEYEVGVQFVESA